MFVDEDEGPLPGMTVTIVTDDGSPVTDEHVRLVGIYLEAGRPISDANVALRYCVPPALVFLGEAAEA
jgi:hypothetical protein